MHDRLVSGGVAPDVAPLEATWLVVAATARSRTQVVADKKAEVGEDECLAAYFLADRRIAGEPLQYITGISGFRRLDLAVGPGVFIPRPETELVAGKAMELLPRDGTIVDIGTGSGAIALSIADERPDARVLATEASKTALGWARKNRATMGLHLDILDGDLFAPLPHRLKGHIDVVVSNPPYVAWSMRHRLPRDVVEHEPSEALFAGDEGRTVIGRVATEAREWLKPRGWLVLEIGEDQGPPVKELLQGLDYQEVAIDSDLAQRDRLALGRML